MQVRLDLPARTVTVTTNGLTRVDCLIDGHPGSSSVVGRNAKVTFGFPAATGAVELLGFAGETLRQRRRIAVGS